MAFVPIRPFAARNLDGVELHLNIVTILPLLQPAVAETEEMAFAQIRSAAPSGDTVEPPTNTAATTQSPPIPLHQPMLLLQPMLPSHLLQFMIPE